MVLQTKDVGCETEDVEEVLLETEWYVLPFLHEERVFPPLTRAQGFRGRRDGAGARGAVCPLALGARR